MQQKPMRELDMDFLRVNPVAKGAPLLTIMLERRAPRFVILRTCVQASR